MCGLPELFVVDLATAGENILTSSGAKVQHHQADRAFYSRSSDLIHLPRREAVDGAPGYNGTALHELAHWTGHVRRRQRTLLAISGNIDRRLRVRSVSSQHFVHFRDRELHI
jgi:antirestriction protein ArdC